MVHLREQSTQEDLAQDQCALARLQGKTAVVLADNAALSGRAYAEEDWPQVLARIGQTEDELAERYRNGAVVFLGSTAIDPRPPCHTGLVRKSVATILSGSTTEAPRPN